MRSVALPGRLAAACVAALVSLAVHSADILPPGAQSGDLIFREGTEAVSAAVLAVDRGTFSHVGMLSGEPGRWQVIHASPSEVKGRPDGVVIDTLDFFTDPVRAHRFAVYQIDATPPQRDSAVRAAMAMLGKPFRMADSNGIYCTTLVWQAWRTAGVDLDVQFSDLQLPLIPGSYLLPSALLASPRIRLLALP